MAKFKTTRTNYGKICRKIIMTENTYIILRQTGDKIFEVKLVHENVAYTYDRLILHMQGNKVIQEFKYKKRCYDLMIP